MTTIHFEKLTERPTNIQRTKRTQGRELSPLSAAILETATTGGAVKITIDGISPAQLRGKRTQYSALARRHGYTLRSRTDDNFIYLWVEKLEKVQDAPAVAEVEGIHDPSEEVEIPAHMATTDEHAPSLAHA